MHVPHVFGQDKKGAGGMKGKFVTGGREEHKDEGGGDTERGTKPGAEK